jgi:RNA-directed DNA polymerase
LGITYIELRHMIEVPERHYGCFRLRKRRGGYREIRCPDDMLKAVQRWILDVILTPVQPHSACKGFKRGDSIVYNAVPHTGQPSLLKADLFRFFETISEKRVYAVFRSLGYHANLAVDLAQLCTVSFTDQHVNDIYMDEACPFDYVGGGRMLPQGAPTSPALANLAARRLDSRLDGLAQKLGISYTRYADDLSFSGERKSLPGLSLLTRIVRQEGFYINREKTTYRSLGQQLKVTGLIVSGQEPRVPKEYKRDVRRHLHFAERFGPEEHLRNIGSEQSSFQDWLLGRIIYIKSIEPDVGNAMLQQFNAIKWALYE